MFRKEMPEEKIFTSSLQSERGPQTLWGTRRLQPFSGAKELFFLHKIGADIKGGSRKKKNKT